MIGHDEVGKLKLIRRVYDVVMDATESFRDNDIGVQLTYLFGAISNPTSNSYVEWYNHQDEEVIKLFRKLFDEEDDVWKFIKIADEDEDEHFGYVATIKMDCVSNKRGMQGPIGKALDGLIGELVIGELGPDVEVVAHEINVSDPKELSKKDLDDLGID